MFAGAVSPFYFRENCRIAGGGNMVERKWVAVLAAFIAVLVLQCASAEYEADLGMTDPYTGPQTVLTWREMNVSKDTKLPVYSVPFEDSWRGAKGKASLSMKEKFTLLGTVESGTWGMVDYRVDKKSRRVGWIRMPEGTAGLSKDGDLALSRIPLRVKKSAVLTDDPQNGSRKIRTVKEGEKVIGMLTCREKGWIYVETKMEDKTVWGFVPLSAVENISESLITVEDDTCTVAEGVAVIGTIYEYVTTGEKDENGYDIWRLETIVQPGDLQISRIDLEVLNEKGVRYLKLPGSLRKIGMEGISIGDLEELRLGGGIEEADEGFYGVQIHRLVLEKDYTGGIPDGQYMTVDEWRVEEGNPLYSDVDGVLYSADGKRLLRYPNGRTEDHYDVPAGTEEIGPGAFSDDQMNICLKSISLPLGLKKIGERAFADCGYLLSLTVPLTVTELAPDAFAHCVSLERLSLPNGLMAKLDDWVKQEDFSAGAFRGDNWATYPKPAEKEDWELENGETFRTYYVRLDNEEGRGTVTVYADAEGSVTREPERVGAVEEYVFEIRNGRAYLGEDRWVELRNLRNDAGDVFFRIIDGEPDNPAKWTESPETKLHFSSIWGENAIFNAWENGEFIEEIHVDLREVILYRTKNKGIFGIILPEGDSAALTDTPEGTKINHLYPETQAKVLAESGDRVKVETAYGTGWVSRSELKIVEEKPETAER